MQKLTGFLAALIGGTCACHDALAATHQIIWGDASSIKPFALVNTPTTIPGVTQASPPPSKNQLRYFKHVEDEHGFSHVRYNQYYQSVPVFGYQVIYHTNPQNPNTITGTLLQNIDKDLSSVLPQIKPDHLLKSYQNGQRHQLRADLTIYFDEAVQKALLAYHLTYYETINHHIVEAHHMIDANTGMELQFWDGQAKATNPCSVVCQGNLCTGECGQGPGGVQFNNLPYRPGNYQFGSFYGGVNSLAKFRVVIDTLNNTCTLNHPDWRVYNLENQTEGQLPFSFPAPLTVTDGINPPLLPFSYACNNPDFLNVNDNGFAPVNQGWSPINDAAYFTQETFKMFQALGLAQPLGTNIPLLVFTHVANLENAYAFSSPSVITSHNLTSANFRQQVVLGNGANRLAPYTNGEVVGHEIMHIVIGNSSNLVYANQSGGINESLADAAGVTLKQFLRNTYPWYWDGLDWTLDWDISKVNQPSRYMNNPPLDGNSIDNAMNYTHGMPVHHSSGVFNKAFYLLSTAPGWRVDLAFQVFLDANQRCLVPNSDYSYAACCMIQAAQNRGYAVMDVLRAFNAVGIRYSPVCRRG